MSLLLDALKKAGQGPQNDATGQRPSSAADTAAGAEPARAAGKAMFNAKKIPATGGIIRGIASLGIVPLALIGGFLFATVYGTYVWYQLRPVPEAVRPATHHPSPPPASLPPAAAPLALTPAPEPKAETATPAEPAIAPRAIEQQEAPPAAVAAAEPVQQYARPEAPAIRIQRRQQTNRVDAVLSSAYQSYQEGDLDTAQKQYVAALKQDARNRDALLGMAAVAQQKGQDAIAAQYYQHVLTLDPRDPVAQAGMAALSNDTSPTEESRLKTLLAQQPQSAALNFALGNLYAGQQRWPEAQQAYFNAYNLQPDSADYALNLAVSLDHLGQGKAAAQYYQRALQLGNSSKNAGFDRQQVQQRLDALRAP